MDLALRNSVETGQVNKNLFDQAQKIVFTEMKTNLWPLYQLQQRLAMMADNDNKKRPKSKLQRHQSDNAADTRNRSSRFEV